MSVPVIKCNFCDGDPDTFHILTQSPEAAICDECVARAFEVLVAGGNMGIHLYVRRDEKDKPKDEKEV